MISGQLPRRPFQFHYAVGEVLKLNKDGLWIVKTRIVHGTIEFPNIGKYIGPIKEDTGARHGRGRMFLHGRWFSAMFKDDVIVGKVRMAFPDGSRYVGDVDDKGKRHGFGKQT